MRVVTVPQTADEAIPIRVDFVVGDLAVAVVVAGIADLGGAGVGVGILVVAVPRAFGHPVPVRVVVRRAGHAAGQAHGHGHHGGPRREEGGR